MWWWQISEEDIKQASLIQSIEELKVDGQLFKRLTGQTWWRHAISDSFRALPYSAIKV